MEVGTSSKYVQFCFDCIYLNCGILPINRTPLYREAAMACLFDVTSGHAKSSEFRALKLFINMNKHLSVQLLYAACDDRGYIRGHGSAPRMLLVVQWKSIRTRLCVLYTAFVNIYIIQKNICYMYACIHLNVWCMPCHYTPSRNNQSNNARNTA